VTAASQDEHPGCDGFMARHGQPDWRTTIRR
jgi:hypothetical protein